MRIVLELGEKDLRYFRDALRRTRQGAKAHGEQVVIEGAAGLVKEATQTEAPEFIRNRLGRLELLVRMLEDDEWRLTGADRARVLDALAYFVDPDDIIPDRVPGLGYLDDAIMVELVLQELRHEIEAYEKFCEFRLSRQPSEDEVGRQRTALQARMRRRRRRDREVRRSKTPPGRSPFSLW
jgi:uncharacterized membrane protein YkvA (DUF1232 family)